MQNFRALVVHTSEQVTASLVEELQKLDVPADSAANAGDAIRIMESTHYGAVLLDDELPDAGSLKVFEALDREGKPDVLMVSVPRAALAAARDGSSDQIEFVASPETPPETERLAMRIRGRLLNAGLAEEFGSDQPRKSSGPTATRGATGSATNVHERGLVLAIIGVLVILAVLLLILRVLQADAASREPTGERPAPSYAVHLVLESHPLGYARRRTDIYNRDPHTSQPDGTFSAPHAGGILLNSPTGTVTL